MSTLGNKLGKQIFPFTKREDLPVRLRNTKNHFNCPKQFVPIVAIKGSIVKRVLIGVDSAGYAILAKPTQFGYSPQVNTVHLDKVIPT